MYLAPSPVLEEHLPLVPSSACWLLNCFLRTWCCSLPLIGVHKLQRWMFPPSWATSLAGAAICPVSYQQPFLEQLPKLAAHKNFCLAGLVSPSPSGRASSIYVHSKLVIVDDAFFLVGSANLVDLSMDRDHTELAVASWGTGARDLRDALYSEHAGEAVPSEYADDPVASLRWLRDIARRNASQPGLQGQICTIDGRLYGNCLFGLSLALEFLARRATEKPLSFL